jgi:hypothetical protein
MSISLPHILSLWRGIHTGNTVKEQGKEATMQNIIPHAMAYFTVDGQTPEGHNQLGFHVCNLFNEQEAASIKSAVTGLNRYITNLDRLDGVKDAYQEFKDELMNLDSRNPRS